MPMTTSRKTTAQWLQMNSLRWGRWYGDGDSDKRTVGDEVNVYFTGRMNNEDMITGMWKTFEDFIHWGSHLESAFVTLTAARAASDYKSWNHDDSRILLCTSPFIWHQHVNQKLGQWEKMIMHNLTQRDTKHQAEAFSKLLHIGHLTRRAYQQYTENCVTGLPSNYRDGWRAPNRFGNMETEETALVCINIIAATFHEILSPVLNEVFCPPKYCVKSLITTETLTKSAEVCTVGFTGTYLAISQLCFWERLSIEQTTDNYLDEYWHIFY